MGDKKILIKVKEEDSRSPARLQTFRHLRDLTLSSSKPPKKQYTPNLNVVRNKDRNKEVVKTESAKKTRINNEKFVRDNGKDRFVQSSGIFSEGSAESKALRLRAFDRSSSGKDSEPAACMLAPTIKRTQWTVNNRSEEGVLDELMGKDEEDDSDVELDEKLPFVPVTWSDKFFRNANVTRESVKGEDLKYKFEDNLAASVPDSKLKVQASNYLPEEFQFNDTQSDTNPTLTLWNLPDSFAGKGLSDDPNVKKIFDFPLSAMLEGKIGKLCIRRSGKIEVVIGRVKYNLEPTELSAFTEELVALGAKDNYNQPAAAVLGQIENRYMLNPDWGCLL